MLEGNASSPVVSVGLVACIVKWRDVSPGMRDQTPAGPSWQWAAASLPLCWAGWAPCEGCANVLFAQSFPYLTQVCNNQ